MPATTPRRSPHSVLDLGAGNRAFCNSSTPTLGKSLSAQRRAVGRLSDGLSDSSSTTNNNNNINNNNNNNNNINNNNNNNNNNKMPRAAPVSPSPSPSPSAGHPSRRRSASGDDGMELLAEADLVAPRRRSCSGENSLGLDLDLLMLPDDGAGVRGQEKRHQYPDKLGPLESARVKATATVGGDRLFITTPRGHEHRRKTPRLVHSASPRHQPADLDAVVAAAAVPVPEMGGAAGDSDTEKIATAAAVMLATAGGGGRKKVVDPFVASLMKPTASLQSMGAAIAQRSKLRKPRPVGGVTSPLAAGVETGGGKPVGATTPPRRHARSFSQQPTNMTEVADRVLAAAAVVSSAHRVEHSNAHLACVKSSDSSRNSNNFRKPKPMDLTPLAATSHKARTLNPEQQQLLAPLHGDGGSDSVDTASPSSAARESFLLHMDDLLTPTPENSPRHHHQQRRRASRPRAGSHTGSTPGSNSSPKAGSTPRRREHHGSRRLGKHGSNNNNNNNNPLDAVERVARESKVNGVEAPKPPTPTDRKPLPGAARLSSGHSALSSPVPSPSPSPSVSPTNHAQPRRRRLHSHFEGLQSSRSAALPSRSPPRSPTAAAESKVPAYVESKVCH